MKKVFKKIISAFLLCCLLACALASCGSGIDGETKNYLDGFLSAIVNEDYEEAETHLHPERSADLKSFLANIEANESIDFQKGIKIEKYKDLSAEFDAEVAGYNREIIMRGKVGGVSMRFIVNIVQNANGYGIYELKIDRGNAEYE